MLNRAKPDRAQPTHRQNADAARRLVSKRQVAGSPLEMRQQELLQANTLATLALYELLAERGIG